MGVIEQMFNYIGQRKEAILEFKIDNENNNQVNEMYISILEKEIELGCELVRELGLRYTLGRKLDDEELQGKKYQLEMRLKERERLNPLPF